MSRSLAAFTLTERVTGEELASWQGRFPGLKTRQILLLLADQSAFHALPSSDLCDPPPACPTAAEIFDSAFAYSKQTSHNLPNLLAVRRTLHFENDLEALARQAGAVAISSPDTGSIPFIGQNDLPQSFTGQSHSSVTYRDGQEVLTSQAAERGTAGLTTSGEFGPLLLTVLSDAKDSSFNLSYWQESGDKRLAVFHYQVPAQKSHYLLEVQDGGDRQTHPAYHGEITIAPDTGSIVRITLVSDPAKTYDPSVGIFVDYGPVILGDRAYVVPLHAAALTRYPIRGGFRGVIPVQSYLNDVIFSEYQLFRADARIVIPEDVLNTH